MPVDLSRSLRGALAGAAAAGVWAAQQPLDIRFFGVPYDDVRLLGTWVADGPASTPVGLALHLSNGALFGALYAQVAPRSGVPAPLRGPLAGLAEHLATWPGTRWLGGLHPRGAELPPLWGSGRAFAQATWRHLLFGLVLGELERRLNAQGEFEPLEDVPVASNGHGNIEHAAVGAAGAEAH
jgi:hypothetical protein